MNEARHSLDRLAAATGRLLASASTLSDAQAREPSLLPGWSRGHVLTHIARNADGMVNLLRWARTGTQTPMYASAQSRAADIEAGAGRDDVPPCVAWAMGAKDSFRLGPEQAGPPAVIINGQPADLLAWLLGRGDGARLTLARGDALPRLPPWR